MNLNMCPALSMHNRINCGVSYAEPFPYGGIGHAGCVKSPNSNDLQFRQFGLVVLRSREPSTFRFKDAPNMAKIANCVNPLIVLNAAPSLRWIHHAV